MGRKTKVSWTMSDDGTPGASWNFLRGCSRTAVKGPPGEVVQSGCGDNTGGGCYAEASGGRFCGKGLPYEGLVRITKKGERRWTGKVRYLAERLMDPIRWRKARRIFTTSVSDPFHDEVPTWVIDKMVAVMLICAIRDGANHTFQTLTKRVERMREYFIDPGAHERVARAAGAMMEDGDHWFDAIMFRPEGLLHPLLWWGASVEHQLAADHRLPILIDTPAAVRIVSCEPLLGPLEIQAGSRTYLRGRAGDARIHWVITGAESGPRARPSDPAWFRSLRDQCTEAAVPFFLKQAVSPWRSIHSDPTYWVHPNVHERRDLVAGPYSRIKARGMVELPYLDGVQHAAFPSPSSTQREVY